jgi:hypothetical protein
LQRIESAIPETLGVAGWIARHRRRTDRTALGTDDDEALCPIVSDEGQGWRVVSAKRARAKVCRNHGT